ncbi:AAA family ATPase [Streptomyces sp. NPDC050264]|uniref:AAA family ATPase n=1 Tax=Streptomyces sp. NPDC050264 TaxID=3155038 RepID=UPI003420BB5D
MYAPTPGRPPARRASAPAPRSSPPTAPTWPPPCRPSGRPATTRRSTRPSRTRSPAAGSGWPTAAAGSRSSSARGLKRPLGPAELSDGTLRYLLWAAALLTPRPPELLVLNEPETSLHPELLDPLAHLILAAAKNSQVVVVTHARPLADALERGAPRHRVDLDSIELVKESGRTAVAGREGLPDEPLWHWPKR